MKILFLHPTTNSKGDKEKERYIKKFKEKETEVKVKSLEKGTEFMDIYSHEALAGKEILKEVKIANESGFNAIVIDCFLEPSLHAAREISDIPVIGPFESSVCFALQLGYTFSIISFLDNAIPQVYRQVRSFGVESRFSSVKIIQTPVLEPGYKRKDILQELIEASKNAIEKDKTEVIILGCTLLYGFSQKMTEELGIPVIDPVIASLKSAESIVKANLSLSKLYLYKKPYNEIFKS